MGLQLSGSVQLEGNLLVTGSANSVFENISVTNRITANEINVQFVSSSIIYSSGSNRFGDLITDTQQFTGSVDVSGSVTATTLVRRGGTSSQFLMADGSVNTSVSASGAYLPLTGGTLTGALNGTTAGFSGRISGVVGGTVFNTAGLWLQGSSSTDGIAIGGTSGGDKNIDTYGGTLKINSTAGNGLSVTGAATFSSNVGLGVTSSAWFSDRRALQIQSGGSINGSVSTPAFVELGANFFHGSLADTYIASSQATKYRQVSGAHEWYTAPSGTANTAINFTSSMSLTAAGVLTMGSSETGAGRISFNQSSNTLRIQSSKDGTDCTPIEFWSQAAGGGFTQSMIISGSNTGIGTLVPTERFNVNVGGGARAGMALTGEYPYLKFNVTASSANSRNWAFSATNLEAGDFALLQSNAKDGDPVTAGTRIIDFSRSGNATFSGDLTVTGTTNFAGGAAYTKSNLDNVLASGTISISTNSGGGGYAGFLIVSSTNLANADVHTMTTFSVLGRGTTATFSQIQTLTGPSGASSFSTSVPSNGSLTITNTSGGTRNIRMTYTGHNTA
jgi:hypothetical protein